MILEHSGEMLGVVESKLKGDNKQMLTVKGASHCDLYDQIDTIPFGGIAASFTKKIFF